MRYEGEIYRPPGEWKSYLLQCTVGCSHNRCTFCGMYKSKQFHIRPLQNILEDIDMARSYYGDGIKRVFLCDGDAIAMSQGDLLRILEKLYRVFPHLEKVTTYAGPRPTLRKSPEELRELRQAGLVRAYLGVETGSDILLAKVKKGVNRQQMLEAGVRLRECGFDLWAIVLMGLAGPGEASKEHALATAEIINEMRPRHLSAMTYMAVEGTPMYEDVRSGAFRMLTAEEVLEEIRLLLTHISVGPIHFTSNHASNYLVLKGTLPEDAPAMIGRIDQALSGQTGLRVHRGL